MVIRGSFLAAANNHCCNNNYSINNMEYLILIQTFKEKRIISKHLLDIFKLSQIYNQKKLTHKCILLPPKILVYMYTDDTLVLGYPEYYLRISDNNKFSFVFRTTLKPSFYPRFELYDFTIWSKKYNTTRNLLDSRLKEYGYEGTIMFLQQIKLHLI